MSVADFTVLETTQILDQSFRIYRIYFLRLITIAAVILIPCELIKFFLEHVWKQESLGLTVSVTFIGTLISVVGQQLMITTLIAAVSNHYLNRPILLADSLRTALPKIVTVILASISTGLIIGLGFLLLIVPGIIFALLFYLIAPVIVIENTGPIKAMERSKELVEGYMRKVFCVALLLFIIGLLTSGAGMVLVRYTVGTPTIQSPPTVHFVNLLVMLTAQIIIAPLSAIASILLYYDLRIRKEGYDLEMLANQLAATEEVAPPEVAVSE